MFELRVELAAVITFRDLAALQAVGMKTANFGQASYADREGEYPRSQEVAEACFFLGADGIWVPSARHASKNLIVFCEQDSRPKITVIRDHGVIAWT